MRVRFEIIFMASAEGFQGSKVFKKISEKTVKEPINW